MKHTPAIDRALDRAKNAGAPLHPTVIDAWEKEPGCAYALKLYRLERRLVACAESFTAWETNARIYRNYLKKGNRAQAQAFKPSALLGSSESVRRNLLDAQRNLTEYEDMPIAPYVNTESKRWRKSQRFVQIIDAENAIRRQGGKVRHKISQKHLPPHIRSDTKKFPVEQPTLFERKP